MIRMLLCLVVAALMNSSGLAHGEIINWADVNGALAGTPSLSPTNLSFTDVNGVEGLDLTISIAATSQGGGLNIEPGNPQEILVNGVSHVNNRLQSPLPNSGNALTFTFSMPVLFTLENREFGWFAESERVEVTSSALMTGEILGNQVRQTITSGPSTSIVAAANGSSFQNSGWQVTNGNSATTSFTVDFSRNDIGFEPFTVDITAVPEPSSLVTLFGICAGGIVVRRRRIAASQHS